MEATELIAQGAAELIAQEAAELIAAIVTQEAAAVIAFAPRLAQKGAEVNTSAAASRAGSEARRRPN